MTAIFLSTLSPLKARLSNTNSRRRKPTLRLRRDSQDRGTGTIKVGASCKTRNRKGRTKSSCAKFGLRRVWAFTRVHFLLHLEPARLETSGSSTRGRRPREPCKNGPRFRCHKWIRVSFSATTTRLWFCMPWSLDYKIGVVRNHQAQLVKVNQKCVAGQDLNDGPDPD